jgi:fructuronate reductase
MINRSQRPLTRAAVEAVTGRAMVKPPVRLIHIGLGAFSRAHQCWYTSRSDPAGEWGVAAFTGRSPDAARQLNRQDGLFTLVERDSSGDRFSIISCISEAHDGGELDRFFELFADPRCAVVTLTITEVGYLLLPNGAPGSDRALARDIELLRSLRGATPLPRLQLTTPLGRLAAGLAVRRSAGAGPLAVVPCDNVPDNGTWLRTGVRAIADVVDPQLAAWVDENVSFVSTSVDRITPRTSPADRELIGARTGWIDQAPVITEPFTDWVLHGEFPNVRPAWELAGARFVDDIEPFERRKLWLLNGAHSLLAYAGQLRGHATVAQAFADPFCRAAVESLWDDATRHLPGALLDIPAYRASLVARFGNARIDHGLPQIAEDGATKLRMRIAPILSAESASGRLSAGALMAITSWMALLLRGVYLPDSRADEIRAALCGDDVVSALLGLISPASVGDKQLVAAVTDALSVLRSPKPRPASSRGH